MLQIRLSKPANETGGSVKSVLVDTNVACPDHLVLADLPVAKGLGTASATAVIKTVGRRSRRQLGERVHFCVRCDFPIAIYGRLSPCEHAFCLDCSRSDSLCYLCDERIQKIQTIKLMEEIYICAAPHCLKSFLKKSDLQSHIHETHADLLHPDQVKEGNESEAVSARKYPVSDSTLQAPLSRPLFSPSSSQFHECDDKSQQSQQPPSRPGMNSGPVSPFPGQVPNQPAEQHPDNYQSQFFDRAAPLNRFSQQTFDPQGGMRQDSGSTAPQFNIAPPYAPDGTPQFFTGPPYEIPGNDSTPEGGSEPRPLPGYPPGTMNLLQNYPPRPWNNNNNNNNNNMSLGSVPLEPPMVSSQGNNKHGGFMNGDPSQGRGFFFQGDYGISPTANMQNVGTTGDGNFVDPTRDGKGISAPQQAVHLPPPPPIPPPPHLSHMQRGRSFSGEVPPGFGWQPERRESFRGGQD